MRRYYKQQITEEDRELVEELLDVYSLKIFLLLDLCLFTLFLGCLLFPHVSSVWVMLLILALFFTMFFLLLQRFHFKD
jgi:hypothetical protein